MNHSKPTTETPMKKESILIVVLLALLVGTSPGVAGEFEGSSSRSNFQVVGQTVTHATARWRISTLLGEPTVQGDFRYTTATGHDLPWNTYLILHVKDTKGGGGYIGATPDSVGRSGGNFGGRTAGSPYWNRFIARRVQNGRLTDYYDSNIAKAAYKRGLRVVDWRLAVSGGTIHKPTTPGNSRESSSTSSNYSNSNLNKNPLGHIVGNAHAVTAHRQSDSQRKAQKR